MAESTASGPPVGLLANGALFVPPQFYNLPHFGYAGLDAQMQDAMQNWQKGAGAFAGNNVPKFNGLIGSGPNGTFGGGFANMQPTVGGGLLGKSVYSGGWNPYAGRGNQPPGTTPTPGGGGTQPPAGGGTQPPPGGGTTTPPPSGGGGGGILNPTPPGVGNTPANYPTAGAPLYPNTFGLPANPSTGTIKKADGTEVANPFGLTQEQIYFALSGHPDAYRRLMESIPGAAGGQTFNPTTGQWEMGDANKLFHQIVNYYESGGGGFNGGGYTAQDAFNAAKNYSLGLGETTYAPQQFAPGLPMFANMAEAIAAGYA